MRIRTFVVSAGVLVTVAACGSAPAASPSGGAGQTSSHAHGGPPPAAAPLRAGERFEQVGLAAPYRPAPPEGGTDEYRCFLIDPKLTEAAYLTGSQFLPQNAEIVHHGIFYSVPASGVDHARSVDAKAEGDGWQCFGGSGLDGPGSADGERSSYVGAWAPGHAETLIGDRTGYRLEPGSQIVLQVHYNLLATNGKPGPTDQSSIRLRLLPGTAEVTPLGGALLPSQIELPCTPQESGPLCDREAAIADLVKRTGAGAREEVDGLNQLCNQGKPPVAGNTQHCDHQVSAPVLLYAITPHMHLLGRSMSVELNPGTPSARMLLDEPAYNFDDQSERVLPQPVRINAGDTVRVTCTHDATVRSKLPQLKPLLPRYVVWGDGTSDEMCLAVLTVTAKV
ncbi:hypothetical protein [Actinophytocola sp.]|uniref:monooxygenase n=1 Tax=Actinophytocola sp. TaxID=1872138 RepID=UPI002D803098|nr:hypothetical protein [Actinophytocola sp.]HET9139442.1 hypothetical protein [Actinophytocola sp.]